MRDRGETLGVTVHPGDGYSQISIFQVKYSDNSYAKRTPFSIEHFSTEKGIKLGLTKKGNSRKTWKLLYNKQQYK